jgi:hypothetical protein
MKIAVALIVIVLTLLVATTAFAAWGGDFDGSQHPMVGALFFDFDQDGQITMFDLDCSGSYAGISKDGHNDVFLTAGHCLAFTPFLNYPTAYVSFDNDLTDGVSGVIEAESYTWHPEFGHDAGDLKDLGIVLLPAGSVSGIQPVVLPPARYMDGLRQGGALKDLDVEAVGYGVIPIWHQPGGTQFDFTGLRNMAVTNVIGLTKADVLYLQNAQATGDGGVCFGDSGSPQIIAGTNMIISVTSGGNGNCNANNSNYRVDTPVARDFLGQFLNLP